MKNVSKQDWIEWRNHPVTENRDEAIKERIKELTEQILGSTDPEFDRFVKGMVWAYNEVLNTKPDFIDEELSEDEISTGDTGPSGNY